MTLLRAWLLLSLCLSSACAKADTLTVAAASSLTNALTELAAVYEAQNPKVRVRLTFGSSGMLRRQILQGAPIDLFIPADIAEFAPLKEQGLLPLGSGRPIATNTLVLVQRKGGRLRGWESLISAKRIAISNPETVPAGRYAKQTLQHRGLWDVVRRHAIYGNNVRQTLAYVADGNADAGIVFATDARFAKDKVIWVATAVPGIDHERIVYEATLLARSKTSATAKDFVDFLKGAESARVLAHYGFGPGGR